MPAPNGICTNYARTLIRIKARQLRRRPSFREFEQADIEQDLTLYLLSQADRFDPARGSLNTFIACVVDSAAAMMVRQRKREKQSPADGIGLESLADVVDQPDGPPAPLAALVSNADLRRRMQTEPLTDAELYELIESVGGAMAPLPPELRRLCGALMRGNRSTAEQELGLSRRTADAALDLLREHFIRAGLKKK
jgi:RNA polymerase sigma-70 factor (ECF subfamily)